MLFSYEYNLWRFNDYRNNQDKLDLVTLKVNIKTQLNMRVDGIILGGTLGEASTLTKRGKTTLVKKIVEIVWGRVAVIISFAERSTKDAIEVTRKVVENGVID